ncbi:MAG: YgaP family membrane protein [Calditrichia bacterium]
MKKNVGSTDKIVRLVAAAIIVALYFTNTITGMVGLVGIVFAGVLVVTSVVNFCPLYAVVGLNTCPVSEK